MRDGIAQQSLYVGDIYFIDFLGAQGVRMRAVLMDLAGACRHTPYPRVGSLAELESSLEGRYHQYLNSVIRPAAPRDPSDPERAAGTRLRAR